MGNNPVIYGDPDGGNFIILNDVNGAMGFGHAAILVGKGDVWYLYAKNGTATHGLIGKSVGYQDGVKVGSLDDFFNSDLNKDSDGNTLYDRAFGIRTDEETDERIKEAASKAVKTHYIVVGQSCVNLWDKAFNESGNYQWGGSLIPNLDFVIINHLASLDWRKHFEVKVPSIEVGEVMTVEEYNAMFKEDE